MIAWIIWPLTNFGLTRRRTILKMANVSTLKISPISRVNSFNCWSENAMAHDSWIFLYLLPTETKWNRVCVKRNCILPNLAINFATTGRLQRITHASVIMDSTCWLVDVKMTNHIPLGQLFIDSCIQKLFCRYVSYTRFTYKHHVWDYCPLSLYVCT